MADKPISRKRQFKLNHGFYPHEERCICGWRRADHTIWNTDRAFHCSSEQFRGTGKKD